LDIRQIDSTGKLQKKQIEVAGDFSLLLLSQLHCTFGPKLKDRLEFQSSTGTASWFLLTRPAVRSRAYLDWSSNCRKNAIDAIDSDGRKIDLIIPLLLLSVCKVLSQLDGLCFITQTVFHLCADIGLSASLYQNIINAKRWKEMNHGVGEKNIFNQKSAYFFCRNVN
jgi:hypothetical protein